MEARAAVQAKKVGEAPPFLLLGKGAVL